LYDLAPAQAILGGVLPAKNVPTHELRPVSTSFLHKKSLTQMHHAAISFKFSFNATLLFLLSCADGLAFSVPLPITKHVATFIFLASLAHVHVAGHRPTLPPASVSSQPPTPS
jgi:hypothetical protein